MKISIITPTFEREHFLANLYLSLKKQTYTDWEWLIFDSSLEPSAFFSKNFDRRIRYSHSNKDLTIGEKRQILKEQTLGEVIVQCDDDDYYSPNYLSFILKELESADFFTLSSWFCYETQLQEFYYWDTQNIKSQHYMLTPLYPGEEKEIDLENLWDDKQKEDFIFHTQQGYGFSYAYTRSVIKNCHFEPRNFGEDFAFFQEVKKKNFAMKCIPDHLGLIVHRMHGKNTAKVFPQFKIPFFVAKHYFPDFK